MWSRHKWLFLCVHVLFALLWLVPFQLSLYDSIKMCVKYNCIVFSFWTEAVYDVTIIVGNKQDHEWAGTWNNVEVSLSNQNGDKITVMFKGPLYHRTTNTSTMKAKYIGQVRTLLISTGRYAIAQSVRSSRWLTKGIVTSAIHPPRIV